MTKLFDTIASISFRYILPVVSILVCMLVRVESLPPESLVTSLCGRIIASVYFSFVYWQTPKLFENIDGEQLKSIQWIFENTQSPRAGFAFITTLATLIFFTGSFVAFAAIMAKVNAFVLIAAIVNAIFRILGYIWRYPAFKKIIAP